MRYLILILLPINLFCQTIKFQKTNSSDLKLLTGQNKVTLFYLWGTWCKPCVDEVSEIVKLSKEYKNIKVVLINDPSSNVSIVQKVLKNSQFIDSISYILDNKIYNKSIKNNIKRFTREFCKSCAEESEEFINPGVYLYENNGKLLFYNKKYEYLSDLKRLISSLKL